jgi:hypothetical protein
MIIAESLHYGQERSIGGGNDRKVSHPQPGAAGRSGSLSCPGSRSATLCGSAPSSLRAKNPGILLLLQGSRDCMANREARELAGRGGRLLPPRASGSTGKASRRDASGAAWKSPSRYFRRSTETFPSNELASRESRLIFRRISELGGRISLSAAK